MKAEAYRARGSPRRGQVLHRDRYLSFEKTDPWSDYWKSRQTLIAAKNSWGSSEPSIPMNQQHPYRGKMILLQARPEGPDLFRPAYAIAETADARPEHSELIDQLCETATLAFARAREAGEAWMDAHADASE